MAQAAVHDAAGALESWGALAMKSGRQPVLRGNIGDILAYCSFDNTTALKRAYSHHVSPLYLNFQQDDACVGNSR